MPKPRAPVDPIADAIKQVRIASKILISTGNLRITDPIYETTVKKALETSVSFLTVYVKDSELNLELTDEVLDITGPVTLNNLKSMIPKIYEYRNINVIRR